MRRLLIALICGSAFVAGCASSAVVYITPSPTPRPQVRYFDASGGVVTEPLPADVWVGLISEGDPQIAVIFRDTIPSSVEGPDAYFIDVTASDGTVVTDRRLSLLGEGVWLPAGRYWITAYFRGCGPDACTGFMGQRVDICSTGVELRARREYTLAVSRQKSRCDFAEVG